MDQQPRRWNLQDSLELITPKVYFQPGETTTLTYPCILYSIEGELADFADNARYISNTRYSITVIDRDPDSNIWRKVLELPHTALETVIKTDQLYHWNITLYY